MAEFRFTPDQVTAIASQIPNTVSGTFLYAPDEENPGLGTLFVPDEWADTVTAADPELHLITRMVSKREIVQLAADQGKSAALRSALAADDDAQFAWESLTEFRPCTGPVGAALATAGLDLPAAPSGASS